MTFNVQVPRMEDEIKQAFTAWFEQTSSVVDEIAPAKEAFEAGFRAARTFPDTPRRNP